jgi:cellulose synthase/poly-beta-1,6-N-acetylglucosamine synthase-like glycosyltransferase
MENRTNNLGSDNFYSLLIPTYNERENIAILIYMINKYLEEK